MHRRRLILNSNNNFKENHALNTNILEEIYQKTQNIEEEFKKKKILFDDTDIRHAQLKIRLQHDSLSQAQFFRALISGYLSKDKFIICLSFK